MHVSQRSEIASYLPDFSTASRYLDSCDTILGWINVPVERAQIDNDLLPMFYPNNTRIDPHYVTDDQMDDLSLLFLLFAIGCDANIMILGKPSDLCEQYKALARAALGSRGLLEHGSLSAVQMLLLLSIFEVYSWRPNAQEAAWKLKAIGLFIASSVSTTNPDSLVTSDNH